MIIRRSFLCRSSVKNTVLVQDNQIPEMYYFVYLNTFDHIFEFRYIFLCIWVQIHLKILLKNPKVFVFEYICVCIWFLNTYVMYLNSDTFEMKIIMYFSYIFVFFQKMPVFFVYKCTHLVFKKSRHFCSVFFVITATLTL